MMHQVFVGGAEDADQFVRGTEDAVRSSHGSQKNRDFFRRPASEKVSVFFEIRLIIKIIAECTPRVQLREGRN